MYISDMFSRCWVCYCPVNLSTKFQIDTASENEDITNLSHDSRSPKMIEVGLQDKRRLGLNAQL